jgi:hypothetical protein
MSQDVSLARRNLELLKLAKALTKALEAADLAYHRQFEGDSAAMRAYRRPEWGRLVARAKKVLK